MKLKVTIIAIVVLGIVGVGYFVLATRRPSPANPSSPSQSPTSTPSAGVILPTSAKIKSIENPTNFSLLGEESSDDIHVIVKTQSTTATTDDPYLLSLAQLQAEQAALAKGELPTSLSHTTYEVSRKIVRLPDGRYAETQMNLFGFDCAGYFFEQKLITYHNNQRVTISYIAKQDRMRELYPEYFKTEPGCNNLVIFAGAKQFYQDVTSGKLTGLAKEWLDAFDAMTQKVKFD